MTDIAIEGKLKPLLQGGKVADAVDVETTAEGGGTSNVQADLNAKEPGLGNPSDPAGQLRFLSSNNAGTRSWERAMRFRGTFSTSETYLAGEVVRFLSAGQQKLFIAESDRAPNSGNPDASGGFWREIDRVAGRGTWVSEARYEFGDLVSHSGNYWMATTTIALSQPAPSATNTAWAQIDGSGGGGGGGVATEYVRTSTATITFGTEDIRYVICEPTSSGTQTITLPDASGSGKEVVIINNRSQRGEEITIAFDSDDSIPDQIGALTVPWRHTTGLADGDDNTWFVSRSAFTRGVPNYPQNPQNSGNTFEFSVGPNNLTTIARDLNTVINMRTVRNVDVNYALSNLTQTNIANAIPAGSGFIIQKTADNGNGDLVTISVEGTGNSMFVDGVSMTSYTIPLNQSVWARRHPTLLRWEVTTFASLVGGTGGAGGATGQSGGANSTDADISDLVKNTSGGVINEGDMISVEARLGNPDVLTAIFPTSNGTEPFTHVAMSTSNDGDMFQALSLGTITNVQAYDSSNNPVYGLLTIGQFIYRDPVNSRYSTNSNQTDVIGEVRKSEYTVPTTIGHTAGTGDNDLQIGSSGAVTKYINKTVDLSGSNTTPIDVRLPPASLTPVGSVIVFDLNPDAGQNVSIAVAPHSNVNMFSEDGSTQYTLSNRLTMSSADGKQIRKFRLDPPPEGSSFEQWVALENGEDVARHEVTWDRWTFLQRKQDDLAAGVQQNVANIDNNSNSIAALQTAIVTTIAGNTYATTGTNKRPRSIYSFTGANTDLRTFTIDSLSSSGWGLTQEQRGVWFSVQNKSAGWVKVVSSDKDFQGLSTDTFFMRPGEYRTFWITRDSGVYNVDIVGPVEYDLYLTSDLIATSNNAQLTMAAGIPTELAEVPTANQDRLVFKLAGSAQQEIHAKANWYQASGTGFISAVTMVQDKNDTLHRTFSGVSLDRDQGRYVAMPAKVSQFDVAANDYLSLGGANLGTAPNDARIVEIEWHVRYIIKEY